MRSLSAFVRSSISIPYEIDCATALYIWSASDFKDCAALRVIPGIRSS